MTLTKSRYDRIAFLASSAAEAVDARDRLIDRYVITSYSIHYTKLYERSSQASFLGPTDAK